MAVAIRTVNGEAISGPETITPARVTFPIDESIDYRQYEVVIPFTHIQRDVDINQKTQMKLSMCSSGRLKKYDEDINGQATCATFSWWSVYLDDNARGIVMQNREEGWEVNPFFEGRSMYGKNRLVLPLNRMMEVYRENCAHGAYPVVRILGTFQYTREWMHSFVITPNNDIRFQNHPIAAKFGVDGILIWNQNPLVEVGNGTYNWRAFSTVHWDNSYHQSGKERFWHHLSFAFHLDPLPDNVLNFQEQDVNDVNWQMVPQ